MKRRAAALLAVLCLTLLAAGCAPRPAFRIGYPAGQPDGALMAQVVAETLRQAGARAVVAACPDLLACGRALQAGDLDLLPTYSGSARAFFRSRAIESGELSAVREALSRFDLGMTPGFGFQAPYRLLTRVAEAPVAAGLDSIDDLAGGQARFAVPPGYARQPGDGLFALARRYGLEIAPERVREFADPAERLAALFDGRVDVVVIRMPLVPEGRSIKALADPLNFYPVYEATLAMGRLDPGDRAFVEQALKPLFGALAPEDVWPPMDEIVVQGRSPELMARRLLVAEGVIDTETPTVRRPEMVIAFAGSESPGDLGGKAVFTVRRAFPDRPLELVAVGSPMAALESGRAELALVYTSDFFDITWSGGFQGRDPRGEAIAVVGRLDFLLLTRRDRDGEVNPLDGKVGIPPSWTAAGHVGARMLALTGRTPATRGTAEMLLAGLREGELDAAIVLRDSRTREVLQGLGPDSGLVALNFVDHLVSPPFFLNEVRLTQSPLPGQAGPLDTYSMQVLLASPAPDSRAGPVHGGPASAVATRSLPLPLREAEALAAATESPELPDPVLPSFRDRDTVLARRDRPGAAWIETSLIVAAVAFVVWAGWLLAAPIRRGP